MMKNADCPVRFSLRLTIRQRYLPLPVPNIFVEASLEYFLVMNARRPSTGALARKGLHCWKTPCFGFNLCGIRTNIQREIFYGRKKARALNSVRTEGRPVTKFFQKSRM